MISCKYTHFHFIVFHCKPTLKPIYIIWKWSILHDEECKPCISLVIGHETWTFCLRISIRITFQISPELCLCLSDLTNGVRRAKPNRQGKICQKFTSYQNSSSIQLHIWRSALGERFWPQGWSLGLWETHDWLSVVTLSITHGLVDSQSLFSWLMFKDIVQSTWNAALLFLKVILLSQQYVCALWVLCDLYRKRHWTIMQVSIVKHKSGTELWSFSGPHLWWVPYSNHSVCPSVCPSVSKTLTLVITFDW
jgi:hypothetical protein